MNIKGGNNMGIGQILVLLIIGILTFPFSLIILIAWACIKTISKK